jgi:hypothetical protein
MYSLFGFSWISVYMKARQYKFLHMKNKNNLRHTVKSEGRRNELFEFICRGFINFF